MPTSELDLDSILNELGQFGLFQWRNFILIGIPIAFTGLFTLSYVFAAADLEYRCRINECESISTTEYNPDWIQNAVPFNKNVPSTCYRYKFLNDTECSANSFDKSVIYRCDDFIYNSTDKTLVNEWDITCDDNKWKLSLIGTMQNAGQFVALPIAGYLSDRFGRRTVFLYGFLIRGVIGIIKSFSTSWLMYIILEFVDPALGSGMYSAGFILGMEIVYAKQRILGATLINVAFALGEVSLGFIAYFIRDWRTLIRMIYPPAFFFVGYFWLIPESVRWLITKGKNDEAVKILKQVGKVNKKPLSEESIQLIYNYNAEDEADKTDEKKDGQFMLVLKSSSLLKRLAVCIFIWMTNTLVYYGLSLNSVLIEGNQHVNFMLVCLIEIPAVTLNYFISHKVGRRKTLFASFLICGISVVISGFIPSNISWLKLLLFLIGKFSISVSFLMTYVFTTELFPTNLRHRCLGMCSMFGRIGSMVAPQTPLLAGVFTAFPTVFMGGVAAIASFMVLLLPETLNVKLPDTIEEAINISSSKQKNNKI